MKISILMSFYNAEPFLTPCIQSILNQTESDWELIAVNDFATDQSVQIIRRFAERDSRIKVLENTREGIVPALQLALKHSSGQLITRMDADDLMQPNKLKLMKTVLQQNGPGSVITCLVKYFSHEGPVGGGYLRYAEWLNNLTLKSHNFTEVYRECVIPSPAWMCFRSDLLAADAFHPEVYPEDYDLCFRFYRQKLKVIGLPQILHHWRDYPHRTSRTDARYANPRFFALKVPWFNRLDRDSSRPLVLWGAGPTGKELAQHLTHSGNEFIWITGNPTKHGKNIYGTVVQPESILKSLKNPQILIAISAPKARYEIEETLQISGLKKGKDVFYFC